MTLTRLPGSKWWIEIDDTSFEIVDTYNKAQITADIQAINATLANLPNPSQEATDVSAVLNQIDRTDWTAVRKARISDLVNTMYQAYQGEPQSLEISQLITKRDALIALRDRLV